VVGRGSGDRAKFGRRSVYSIENVPDWFPLPVAPSTAESSGIVAVIVPSPVNVSIIVYSDPEPLNVAGSIVPGPLICISVASNPVTALEKVIARGTEDTFVGEEKEDTIEAVGPSADADINTGSTRKKAILPIYK
jgi:hypothetical protein